jgi:hypothetical protein
MINVICLKHGELYGPEYVNKLYNMIQRNLTLPHRFICFTENSTGISSEIEIRQLPLDINLSGWWWKLYLFKKDHFAKDDTILFFDLDMVIVNNINTLITYLPDHFVGLEDVGRVFRKFPKKLGSAVMRWTAGTYSDIWETFILDPTVVKQLKGDQDWIWYLHKNSIEFYPEKWIQSYKWEIRMQSELIRVGRNQIFKTVRSPYVDPETSVIAFHGTPNPEDVFDPVIVNNWK